jgi:CRP-like cAMP-binding protein
MSLTLLQVRACQNRLLAKLSDDQLEYLLSVSDMVETNVKEVLVQQGGPIEYAYFPCTSALSCLVFLEEGSFVEVGTVGNEGFTSMELLLDATFAVESLVCQIRGTSVRISVDAFRKAVGQSQPLRKLLRCSAQAYLSQVSQSVACNRMHSVDLRFARWLLVTHDRVEGNKFDLTQEFLAGMLGVHRPSISVVAGLFQQAGMIRYTRGHMEILDRSRLEESACECYSVVRKQFQRLLDLSYGG